MGLDNGVTQVMYGFSIRYLFTYLRYFTVFIFAYSYMHHTPFNRFVSP